MVSAKIAKAVEDGKITLGDAIGYTTNPGALFFLCLAKSNPPHNNFTRQNQTLLIIFCPFDHLRCCLL